MANSSLSQLQETISFIKNIYPPQTKIGIVLGSGLGNFASEIKVEKVLEYAAIPHFPVSTVKGHGGKLLFGELGGKKVVIMSGRIHFYEGYHAQQITYPIRIMQMLGVETLLLSNAAGGVNPAFKVGDLMLIKDHISLFVTNPLIGKNEDELGTRFPDMSEPYNKALLTKAKIIGERYGYNLKEGIYLGVTGPSFETRAEYQLIKTMGGDAVGMSTVQEVIVAVHAGMRVLAVSVITDLGIRKEENIILHEDVLSAANDAEPKLTQLFTEIVAGL